MYEVVGVLGGIVFVALLIGMVKPSLVIRWGETRNRWRVVLVYGVALIVLSLASQAVAPPEVKAKQEQERAIAAQQKLEKEQAEAQAKLQKKQEEKLKEEQKQQEKAAKERQKEQDANQKANMQAQTYKNNAQQIPYNMLVRAPEKYKKSIVAYRGQVRNIIDESDREQTFSLDIVGDGTFVVVEFTRQKQDERVLPGDVLIAYGEFRGVEEYSNTATGAPVYMPLIKAKYLEASR